MSDKIIKILMERDNLSLEDAKSVTSDFKQEFDEAIASGADYEDIALMMDDYFGLEPDYIEDFLYG